MDQQTMPFLVDITKAMIHSKLKVIKMLLVPFACVFNGRQTNKGVLLKFMFQNPVTISVRNWILPRNCDQL